MALGRILRQQLVLWIVTIVLYYVLAAKRILRGSHRERDLQWDKLTRLSLVMAVVGPWMANIKRWYICSFEFDNEGFPLLFYGSSSYLTYCYAFPRFVWIPALSYAYSYLDGSETRGGR